MLLEEGPLLALLTLLLQQELAVTGLANLEIVGEASLTV